MKNPNQLKSQVHELRGEGRRISYDESAVFLRDKKGNPERMFMGVAEPIWKMFEDLEAELSPENLNCDGEISATQADIKFRQLTRKWRKLEAIAGLKVNCRMLDEWRRTA
jgi:hypothetical protein